jgi:hypothetical protein
MKTGYDKKQQQSTQEDMGESNYARILALAFFLLFCVWSLQVSNLIRYGVTVGIVLQAMISICIHFYRKERLRKLRETQIHGHRTMRNE